LVFYLAYWVSGLALEIPALPLTQAADPIQERAARRVGVCDTNSNARTNSEVQWIIGRNVKAAYRLPRAAGHGYDMANIDDEIDPIKVRSALFALITAGLEDAHVFAVKGQSRDWDAADTRNCIIDIRSILDAVQIQLDAVELIG
jgi:hypothetical protein